jgi:phosphoribosylpyrophosphate synthetase
MAKLAMGQQRWADAEGRLAAATRTRVDPLHQERLGLLRNRSGPLDDRAWQAISAAVAPAGRFPETALMPELTGVWACGAYYSRGYGSDAPWSRFLRSAKDASEDRDATLSLACGYLCRYLAEHTPLIGIVDLVVPIPANPDRYGQRMLSLPDELARSVEAQLAVPMRFDALSHSGEEGKMSQLSWSERRNAVRTALGAGDSSTVPGRAVLVVDDISTSGATFRRAAEILLKAGASKVFGICLAHTEG